MSNIKKLLKDTSRTLIFILIGFVTTSFLFTLLYSFLPVPVTPLMVLRTIEQQIEKGENVYKHDWVRRSYIDSSVALAVICAEDQNFYHHWGFDMEAIQESIEEYKKGKRLRGASTISQQTAKNVFLYPSRSWLRKGLEVYFTFMIELFWTKDRILTVYLNSIEFGTGIYGVEAASQYFYDRSAEKLNRSQSALLAAVLPNPHRFRVDRPSNYIRGRQQWILKQMSQHNFALPRQKIDHKK